MTNHALPLTIASRRRLENGCIMIIGAGIAGLAAGTALHAAGRKVCVLEQSEFIGGMARTDEIDGFLFDQTGHFLHLSDPDVKCFFRCLGVPLMKIRRQATVMLGDKSVPYPLQYNMWALEAGLRQAALEDLRAAQTASCHDRTSFEAALRSTWGDALMNIFFLPYHEKLWSRPLTELPSDCFGRYTVKVDMDLAERGYTEPVSYSGYNSTFYYPESGRVGDLVEAMAEPIRDRILLNAQPVRIDARERSCWLADGQRLRYESLISTASLPCLLNLLGETAIPTDLLRFGSVANVRVGFRGRLRVPYHWTYLPDRDVPVYRVGFPPNVSHRTVRTGYASLSLEYGVPSPPESRHSAHQLAQAAVSKLKRAGWIDVDEVVLVQEQILSPAYVACRSEGRPAFREVRELLRSAGIHLAGRFGLWDNYSMEDALRSGVKAARDIERGAGLRRHGGD